MYNQHLTDMFKEVWSNTNPDADFASQSINVNSDGKLFIVETTNGNENPSTPRSHSLHLVSLNTKTTMIGGRYDADTIGSRDVTITQSGSTSTFAFGVGRVNTATINGWIIPVKIYKLL